MGSSTKNDRSHSVVVVMPAFNEAEGISDFIHDLNANLSDYRRQFIVVDDCSTDSTGQVLRVIKLMGEVDLEVMRNHENRGHGLSTRLALSLGARAGSDVVLACDGDGQISGMDAKKLVDGLVNSDVMVVEGCRIERSESTYRAVVSLVARFLVFLRCGSFPKDANSPFRAYRSEALKLILRNDSIGGLVPNLHISAFIRKQGLSRREISVKSLPRRGSVTVGSTWTNNKWSFLPSRRFVKFCVRAIIDWKQRSP